MEKITLSAQAIQKLPKDWIKSLVRKHGTDKHAKGFNTWSHLVSMIFCQFCLWTALITILLFAVLKRQATYKWNFSNLVASLRLNIFTKIDLYVWINEPFTPPPETENDT